MTDLSTDHGAAIELIIANYPRLQAQEPNHPLLAYITGVTSEGFRLAEPQREQFYRIYAPEEDCPMGVALSRYFADIHKALHPPAPAKAGPVVNLDDIKDEDDFDALPPLAIEEDGFPF